MRQRLQGKKRRKANLQGRERRALSRGLRKLQQRLKKKAKRNRQGLRRGQGRTGHQERRLR